VAAAAHVHPHHPRLGGPAWCGALATAPDCRGRRIALVLGAHAILKLQRRFGFESSMTGVELDNAPSKAVCARLGLAVGGACIVGGADPRALRSGWMTA
jgi:hypothetical protein